MGISEHYDIPLPELLPNGSNAFEEDVEYLDEIFDDVATDLHELLPLDSDVTGIMQKVQELRDLTKRAMAQSAIPRASITVPAGTAEDITVELIFFDGLWHLSVLERQVNAGLVRISGGKPGGVVEGRRLITMEGN